MLGTDKVLGSEWHRRHLGERRVQGKDAGERGLTGDGTFIDLSSQYY